MLSRRSIIVLSSLLLSMSLASGVLLILEPRPRPPMAGVSLSHVQPTTDPADLLFQTSSAPTPQRWTTIRVHFSGQTFGTAQAMNELHERKGLGGLAYHFVIGNGQGDDDGQVTVGFRWTHQLDGLVPTSVLIQQTNAGHEPVTRPVIDVCLIGDGEQSGPTDAQLRELVWLVQQLQGRLEIDKDHVALATVDLTGHAASTSRLFPLGLFREQLLADATGPR